MKEYGLYESASVKIQTLKTAVEVCLFPLLTYSCTEFPQAARMLLRVDDVVQAIRKEQEGSGGAPSQEEMLQQE